MGEALPTGTVTLLFTDIEGSTRLLHHLGPQAYGRELAKHRSLLRAAFTSHGGVEVDTQGDALFVAFPTAHAAASAAWEGQAQLVAGPIVVRMGMHTGTPTLASEGYVGIDVHRGARVAALAHGGQVLLSEVTAALLDGVKLTDLGAHRLKDFDGVTRLYQLGDITFPPLRTPGTVQLPTAVTPFLGRERELFAAISVVLDEDPRLLTITGPGGTGKTRFAIELARLLAEGADGGTYFVPVATLREPALVLPALAAAVGAEQADPSSIASRVRGKRTQVVLDNLEHLLPDAAVAIASVIAAAPELRLIVTSREALRVAGETELDLPPLVEDEALAFFLAAARRVRPDIAPSAALRELCERLDRLPLALELAAARTKLLSPEALLARLGSQLDLLRGSRDADPRQVTMTATIAWSYDLLDSTEQQLFTRLGLFRGGCSLASAEVVCQADVAVLGSLLDKSLLRRRADPDGADRFWMLETIGQYAADQLASSGEEEFLRQRQLADLLTLAQRANTHGKVLTAGFGRWHLDLVEPEIHNIRAALGWAVRNATDAGLEVATALAAYWTVREPVEGIAWLTELLTAAVGAAPGLRARALRALAGPLSITGEHDQATLVHRQSLELFEALGQELDAVNGRFRLGTSLIAQGDVVRGVAALNETLAEFRLSGQRIGEAQALGVLGGVSGNAGDLAGAADLHAQSAAIAAEVDWPWWQLNQLAMLASCERKLGQLHEATAHAKQGLRLAAALGDRANAVYIAAEIAASAAAGGDGRLAGRLMGAIDAEVEAGGVVTWSSEADNYEALVLAVDGPEFRHERQQGALLSLLEAAGLSGEDA